jgi:hypothetical protein
MNNPKLKEIFDNVDKKSNKDLATLLVALKNDFEDVKETVLRLTATMEEVEVTYDKVYNELKQRLKFEDKNEG